MKDILLLSGGMDSYITYFILEKKAQPLWCDLGQKYNYEERQACQMLDIHQDINILEDTSAINYAQRWGKGNGEIPGRNALLGLIANNYEPDNIYFCFQKGETKNESNDRSQEFCAWMSNILSYLRYGKNFPDLMNEGQLVKVDSPTWNMTKVQLVKWYLDKGLSAEDLMKTFSCYSPLDTTDWHKVHCGNCRACVRRAIALEDNGLKVEGWFGKDVRKSSLIKEYIENIRQGHYEDERALEMLAAFNKWGYDVSVVPKVSQR